MLEGDGKDARANRIAVAVLGIIVVLRVLYLLPFTSQFDLAADESYYWDWGRRLDWGYFSKPPMIGWLMGLVGWLGGHSDFAVRLAPLVLSTLSLWLLHKLGTVFFNERTGLLALLLAVLTPANIALSLFFTIDAPLVVCWTGALIAAWWCVTRPASPWSWLVLTVLLGLGNLSKQMMLVFPLILILFAALTPGRRNLLGNWRLWTCTVLSLLFLTPVLIWNQRHHWVTLLHTTHHFDTDANATLGERITNFVEFPASQIAMFGPVTFLLLMMAAFGGLWRWKQLGDKERFLVMFSAPGLVVFLLLALRQEVHPNWPAVFYISATVLSAAWLERQALPMLRLRGIRGWRTGALASGALLCALAYSAPFAIGAMGLAGDPRWDLTARLRGWKEAGKEAGEYLKLAPRPEKTMIIVDGYREHASELAFNMPQQPFVYRWDTDGRVESQYEVWPSVDDDDRKGWDALIFVPSDFSPMLDKMHHWFDSVEKKGEIHVPIGGGLERSYQVFQALKLQYWPHERKPRPGNSAPPATPAAEATPPLEAATKAAGH